MDNHNRPGKIHKSQPRQESSILSKLFFCWALPLFYQRYKTEVTEDEVFAPLKSHDSGRLGTKLETAWKCELDTNGNPSLWRALWRTFRMEFIAFGSLFIFSEFVLKMSQPWLIGKLMSQYETSNSRNGIYLYSSLLLVSSFLSVMIGHNYLFKIQHLGMKVRIASCSLIYRKALKLNKTAMAETNVGKMVNLLSNDVNRFDLAAMHLLQLIVAPFETIFAIWCLYIMVGPTAITGIVFFILFVPLQMYMGKLTTTYRSRTAKKTDQRIKLMNEIIEGIQVIKMYTWEQLFTQMIKKVRKLEIHQIINVSYLRAFNTSFQLFMNRTGIFLCILTYVFTQDKVDGKYVFVVTLFYAILRQTLTVYFPFGINNFSETRVSVGRITKFLMSDEIISQQDEKELTTYVVTDNKDQQLIKDSSVTYRTSVNNKITLGDKEKDLGIKIDNVSVKWIKSARDCTLNNIHFDASSHELVAIVGSVGSGKSTLLYTILNEIPLIQGELKVKGTISYASQEPWLFSGTIRQNILFGSELDMTKYQKIIEVCALQEDLSIFPNGDGTAVGERGVLLSGGQKARINLARAIYKDADIYLLDDPFAAVDTKVGKNIFQNCLLRYLKNKCTILVTHHLQYLGTVNRVYVMEKGTLAADGNYEELDTSEEKVLTDHTNNREMLITIKKYNEKPREEKEERKTGTISKHVYRKYWQSGGNYCILFALCLLFILTQSGASGADYFLAFWVNLEQLKEEREFFTNQTCIYIYVGIIIFTIIAVTTRSISFFRCCMTASRNLHNNMFSRIIAAPMKFFNTNPSGRILNRFSKDVGLVDEILPIIMMDTLQIALIVLGSMLLITFLNPLMLFPTLIILSVFYIFRIAFLATSRNVKRLEATSRSPVYSHIVSSFQGLTTIRSYNAQNIVKNEFDHYQDLHSSMFYMFLTCNRAFGFWLDMTCVFYMIVAIVSIVLKDTSVGNVGLSITESMNLLGVFQWGIRQWSELENQMTSVERIVEYSEIFAEKTIDNKPNLRNWPNQGRIEFDSVSLQYSEIDSLALDHITITIEPKEKIGVVGRTGAGKSSLISTLFRLFESKGKISIDGINITEVSFNNLRSKISIIPQDPTLFSGTLRQNLDPFQEFDDNELWKALEQVELKSAVSDLPDGLSSEILTGGSNFSVGQRQLICLGRAILRSNKILILDEATANVDPQTDSSIQKTIKRNFENCTVLTIAHRLHTIMDSDRVVVMDAGKIVEFDLPHCLLQNSESLFHQLVQESGKQMTDHLSNIAKQVYEKKESDNGLI